MSGTGYAGIVGQQRLADKNVDWPRGEPLANYTRTMNWDAADDEGGIRPQAGTESRVVEMGRGLARRHAASAATAPDLHGQRRYAWHIDGAGARRRWPRRPTMPSAGSSRCG